MPQILHTVKRQALFESEWQKLVAPGLESGDHQHATTACFSPDDGSYCAIGTRDGRVIVWEFSSLRTVIRSMESPARFVQGMQSQDGADMAIDVSLSDKNSINAASTADQETASAVQMNRKRLLTSVCSIGWCLSDSNGWELAVGYDCSGYISFSDNEGSEFSKGMRQPSIISGKEVGIKPSSPWRVGLVVCWRLRDSAMLWVHRLGNGVIPTCIDGMPVKIGHRRTGWFVACSDSTCHYLRQTSADSNILEGDDRSGFRYEDETIYNSEHPSERRSSVELSVTAIEILNSKGKYGGQHSKPAGCSDTCVEANYGGSAKAHIDEHAAVITYTDGFLFTYLGRSVTRLRFACGDNEKGEKGGVCNENDAIAEDMKRCFTVVCAAEQPALSSISRLQVIDGGSSSWHSRTSYLPPSNTSCNLAAVRSLPFLTSQSLPSKLSLLLIGSGVSVRLLDASTLACVYDLGGALCRGIRSGNKGSVSWAAATMGGVPGSMWAASKSYSIGSRKGSRIKEKTEKKQKKKEQEFTTTDGGNVLSSSSTSSSSFSSWTQKRRRRDRNSPKEQEDSEVEQDILANVASSICSPCDENRDQKNDASVPSSSALTISSITEQSPQDYENPPGHIWYLATSLLVNGGSEHSKYLCVHTLPPPMAVVSMQQIQMEPDLNNSSDVDAGKEEMGDDPATNESDGNDSCLVVQYSEENLNQIATKVTARKARKKCASMQPLLNGLDMALRHAPERRIGFLSWHPKRPLLLAIAQDFGTVYVLEQLHSTNWPGPMYPPGFEVCLYDKTNGRVGSY